jgi:hypothetical protein
MSIYLQCTKKTLLEILDQGQAHLPVHQPSICIARSHAQNLHLKLVIANPGTQTLNTAVAAVAGLNFVSKQHRIQPSFKDCGALIRLACTFRWQSFGISNEPDWYRIKISNGGWNHLSVYTTSTARLVQLCHWQLHSKEDYKRKERQYQRSIAGECRHLARHLAKRACTSARRAST